MSKGFWAVRASRLRSPWRDRPVGGACWPPFFARRGSSSLIPELLLAQTHPMCIIMIINSLHVVPERCKNVDFSLVF